MPQRLRFPTLPPEQGPSVLDDPLTRFVRSLLTTQQPDPSDMMPTPLMAPAKGAKAAARLAKAVVQPGKAETAAAPAAHELMMRILQRTPDDAAKMTHQAYRLKVPVPGIVRRDLPAAKGYVYRTANPVDMPTTIANWNPASAEWTTLPKNLNAGRYLERPMMLRSRGKRGLDVTEYLADDGQWYPVSLLIGK